MGNSQGRDNVRKRAARRKKTERLALAKSEAKVARETMRRNVRSTADADYLYTSLMPHKHLQERFYSFLPFLAQTGPDLIDHVYDHVKLDCPDHILLTV